LVPLSNNTLVPSQTTRTPVVWGTKVQPAPFVPLTPFGMKTLPVAQVIWAPPGTETMVHPVPLIPFCPLVPFSKSVCPVEQITTMPTGCGERVHPTPFGTNDVELGQMIKEPFAC